MWRRPVSIPGVGNERASDAQLPLAFGAGGIDGLEGEADDGRDRRQRDVALVEIDDEAAHEAAVDLALGEHADVGNRGGVGAGIGRGEGEAGQLAAVGQARQVVLLLRIGAVAKQQLGRTERVGDHHGDRGRDVDGGDARHHRGMGEVAEAQAAVLLGNDHAEEPALADELPGLGRQIVRLVDGMLVEHRVQGRHLGLEKGLLVGGQASGTARAQGVEVGPAGEQLALEAHRAGLERRPLGVAHGRQGLGERRHGGTADQRVEAHAGLDTRDTTSAPARRLDRCDVDLGHLHHRVEHPLGRDAIGVGERFKKDPRRDLP